MLNFLQSNIVHNNIIYRISSSEFAIAHPRAFPATCVFRRSGKARECAIGEFDREIKMKRLIEKYSIDNVYPLPPLVASVEGRWFEPRSGQVKDGRIGTCFFSG